MVTPKSPLTDEAVRKVAAHASESGHFYDRHGNQILEVTGAKGQPVRPDLRHARKLDLCRGVTSVIACAAAPQLELWKVRQGIMSALTLPRHDAETEQEWMRRVEDDMRKTAENAAIAGSAIHAAIQAHVQGQLFDQTYAAHVDGAMRALDAFCGPQGWRAEVVVVSQLGYATKCDVVSAEWIVNWKSKDGDEDALAELETYESQHMQSAAELAAGLAPRRAAIGYISRTHPGVARIVEIPQDKLDRGWEMFRALLAYCQAKDNYRPSWAQG